MDPGTLIAARYRLDQRLAAGGMGEVWVAHDELLGRDIALKILHPALAADEGFRRRFRAEARAAARLSHPGVVSVYDFGEDAGVTFLAMELVRGDSLREVLARRGPLPPADALRILGQAADALAEAHAHGLVHRDVKPANLLLTANGAVKVTDFGIARTPDMTTATGEGSVLGTVAYMSPEQVRGERVGAASDVYSLGVVAYELLAGVRPFPAEESIAVALSHLRDPAPPLPERVPPPVADLVGSMLRKEPATRPTIRRVAERAGHAVPPGPGAPETTTAVESAGLPLLQAEMTRPTRLHVTAPAPGPTATFRSLGAVLGAAADKAGGRDARRRAAAGVVGVVVLVALVIGIVLAAAVPGPGSRRQPGGPATASGTSRHGTTQPAVDRHLASSTSSSSTTTTTTSTSTSTPSSSTTSSTATSTSVATAGQPTGPAGGPGPGPAPPGDTGPGGPGGPGHSGTAPGHGGPGHNGPGAS